MQKLSNDDMTKLHICGNCKHFKPHGVMGFDGYSEVCTNGEQYNMKERNWEDSACCDFNNSSN